MFDANIVLFFHALGVAHPWFAHAAAFLNSADVVALVAVALLILFRTKTSKKQVNAFLLLVAVGAIAYLANRLVGAIHFRPRPFVTLHFQPFIHMSPLLKSFPSVHATLSGAVAVWCWRFDKKWLGWTAGALALLIGCMRVFVGVHYSSDVVAGWALGMVTSWFTINYIWKAFA